MDLRGNARHAVEIFRATDLFEEVETAIGKPRDVTQRFVDAKALIGIGGDEARLILSLCLSLEQPANRLGARRVRFERR